MCAVASRVLDQPAEKLELAGGRVTVKGAKDGGIAYGALAARANPLRGAVRPGTEPGLEATAYYGPDRGSTASGVHAMIVGGDPGTAKGEGKGTTAWHNCGKPTKPYTS